MQKQDKYKILIIIVLIVLSLALVMIKGCFKKDESNKTDDKKEKQTPVKLSQDELKKILPAGIDSIMYEYGIKSDWVKNIADHTPQEKPKKDKKKKETTPSKPDLKPAQSDNLMFAKEINIPKDLSLSELNLEIVNFLSVYAYSGMSFEDPKTNNQIFNISLSSDSSKKVVAKINYIYNDKIKRESADVCLVLDNLDAISQVSVDKILNTNEKFSVFLPDNIDKPDLQNIVLESKKDYLVKADIGTVDDITAEFRSDMKEKDWKTKVRSICYEFEKAGGVILVNPKSQFKLETDVLEEFQKYQLKAYKDTIFIKYNSPDKTKKKIDELFSLILNKAKAGNRSQIYLVNFTEDDFKNFVSAVSFLKKRGYKFLTFSEILKRRQKNDNLPQPQPQ